MRRFVWLVVLAGLLWCAWWAIATVVLQNRLTALSRTPDGSDLGVDIGTIGTGGFPMRLSANLQDLRLSERSTQTVITAPRLEISAPTYWPGDLTVHLPDQPITIDAHQQAAQMTVEDGTLGLRLRPRPDLQLQGMTARAQSWRYLVANRSFLSAQSTLATLRQRSDQRNSYDLELAVASLMPGTDWRTLLGRSADWPDTFDTLVAQASVTFDAPLDRTHIDTRPPMIRGLSLHDASVVWGTLSLAASGTLSFDAQGIPDGMLSVNVSDWRTLLDMAQTSGALPATLRQQAELMLRALSAASGGAQDALALAFTFADGQMSLGDIALGPAPRLRLNAPYSQ